MYNDETVKRLKDEIKSLKQKIIALEYSDLANKEIINNHEQRIKSIEEKILKQNL